MRINFNNIGLEMCGGNRTLFEFANGLVDRGHEVTITAVSTNYGHDHDWWTHGVKAKINYVQPLTKLDRMYRRMFLRGRLDYDLNHALIEAMPECDFNIATYCMTAYPTAFAKQGKKGGYLIQNYEPLFFTNDFVSNMMAKSSYFLPLNHLYISNWVKNSCDATGNGGVVIGNGINPAIMHPINVLKEPFTVMAIMRKNLAWKAPYRTISVLNALSICEPRLKAILVGHRDDELLKSAKFEYEFVESPDDANLVKCYNRASVFLYSSEYEGFGLPPLEAMACGTPVVMSDFFGNEYAIDGKNALLSRGDARLYDVCASEHIMSIFKDPSLAERLANEGLKTANELTVNKAVDGLEKYLLALGTD